MLIATVSCGNVAYKQSVFGIHPLHLQVVTTAGPLATRPSHYGPMVLHGLPRASLLGYPS
jgi:hypothetical protein